MFETETVGPCLVSEIEVGEGGDHGPFAPLPLPVATPLKGIKNY